MLDTKFTKILNLVQCDEIFLVVVDGAIFY